jgi:hypothetical protein
LGSLYWFFQTSCSWHLLLDWFWIHSRWIWLCCHQNCRIGWSIRWWTNATSSSSTS